MAKDRSEETTQHVPEGKKLGLKLKYDKKSLGETEYAYSRSIEKRHSKEESKSDTKGKKKKRKSSSSDADGEVNTKKKRWHGDAEDHLQEKAEKPKKKKKRVSFGTGTKEDDGDGEIENGVNNDNENDNDEKAVTNRTTAETDAKEDDKAIEEMKKRKREKKKAKKNGANSTSSNTQIHETPILSYLNRYCRDRSSWKFQKNRETNLFKHLYSLEHVPTQYNAALLMYLQGLKGDSAKRRLSQAAEEIIRADVDDEKKKDADDEGASEKENSADSNYQQAVDTFRTGLSEGLKDFEPAGFGEMDSNVHTRLQKRQRAELVFFAVAGVLFCVEKPKALPKKVAKSLPLNKKKRKNRTAIVDISSSSESDDSSTSTNSSSS